MPAWPLHRGKPYGTWHELALVQLVEYTYENNHKINRDLFLSNSFFNYFMKTKNEKRTVFRFPFFYENVKRMKVLKIQTKNLLNMKMTVNYLNFVFRIEVKTKSKYRILNFVSQFIKSTKWNFGYTDFYIVSYLLNLSRGLS